jgi:predicted kinase
VDSPTLYLICGLPGAGKTHLARKLERDLPALRLTPDDWITTLYGTDLTQGKLDSVRDPVETVQWSVAVDALRLGVSVVLDFGFWTRAEREEFRQRASHLGASSVVFFAGASREELWDRVSARNEDLGRNSFNVSREQLDAWWALFEPPAPDELTVRSNNFRKTPT